MVTLHRDRQLQNVEIIVADISTSEMEASYDRIYSIEMFEVHHFRLLVQSVLLHSFNVGDLKSYNVCFLTAHEELTGSSQEDIKVDETG